MATVTSYAHGTPCWVDLGTTDVAAAQDFYARVMGWTYVDTGEEGGHYQLAMRSDLPVAGMMGMVPEMDAAGMKPGWTIYFAAADADDVAKRVTEHGGTVLSPPMDVMTQGRMLIASDPAHSVFGAWQPRDMPGSGLAGDPGSLAWAELMSRDLAATGDFYADVFGLGRETMDIGTPDPYTVFTVGDQQVAGMMAMPDTVAAEVPSSWMAYFAVADADAAVKTAREGGGSIMSEPRDTPYGRWAMLADPQGAVLSVMSPVES